MRFVGFIGPSYTLKSKNIDCQRCVNLYPELDELGTGKAREVAALVSTPGLRLLVTAGSGVHRGGWTATNGQYFAVNGNKLFRFDSSFTATEIGTLNSSTGQVSIADNGTTLFVVDGDDGYIHTLGSSSLSVITDIDWMGATQVVYQDGYFIFLKPGSQQFYISALNGVDVDALDIASSEGMPDSLVAILSDHRELWLFNERTIEVFYNSGAADFPFERITGAFVEHGCAAAFSVAKMNNTVYWVGQDDKGAGIIFQAEGYQPQRISTHAIEVAIGGYGDISDAIAWTYQQNGHHFYVLNFPTAQTTWVFDTSTKLWHERTYNNQGAQERHRANSHAFAYSKHVVGDYENGNIYELAEDYYSDNAAEIIRLRTSPHICEDLVRIFYNSFQLDVEAGKGLDGTGQGTDPQIMLQYSDDGGHSWSNERWVSLGKIGERYKRAIWRKLGASRDRVFKIAISDPISVTIMGAEIDIVKGAA